MRIIKKFVKQLKYVGCVSVIAVFLAGCANDTINDNGTQSASEYKTDEKTSDEEIPVTEIPIIEITEDIPEAVSEPIAEESVMYTFKKCNPEELSMPIYCIRNLYDYDQIKHSLFLGQVMTLFGEPDYITESAEEMFSCAVSAEDKEGNVLYLEIYYGPSGPAIGGPEGEAYHCVADELAELIMSAEPTDYEWEGVYEDIPANITMGVKNGIPYYEMEPSDIFDEEMESYY